jgi:osmotically-inducible protein OsmY
MKQSRFVMSSIVLGLCLAGAAPALAAAPSDSDITTWVQTALRQDHHVDPAGIEIKTDAGVVTLSGSVGNLATRQRALDDVKKIDGVIGVVDKLGVKTTWRPDADIVGDVLNRIIHNQMISTRLIGVTCNEGAVTLTGVVGSWAELQEAGILAAEVQGVRSLDNKLTLEFTGVRSDDDIKKDVESVLDLDVYLNGLPITASVKNGVVTLSGSVGSYFERDRADTEVRYISHLMGVNNQLKVEGKENLGVRIAASMSVSDKELAKRVTSVLTIDSRVDPSKITVTAASGHVTLAGSVPFGYQKRIAEEDARTTMGTAWVTNELLVPGVRRGDASLRSDILSNFDSDYLLSGMDVTVQVKSGRVTLGGYVNNKAEQAHAEEIVARIVGVNEIKNNIKVDQDQFSDMALTRAVRNRLEHNWLTSGVHDNITVTTHDGSATLTGVVNTWSERAQAGRVALQTAGVWNVHNRLSVRGAAYPWDEWDERTLYYSPYYWVWYW